jgi:hypothetical protein
VTGVTDHAALDVWKKETRDKANLLDELLERFLHKPWDCRLDTCHS